MIKVFIPIVLVACLLKIQLVEAQSTLTDTTFKLKEVVVVAPRLSYRLSGLQSTRFDSLQKQAYYQRSLSDLLADQSPIFVKSYGLGSLATTAFRGGSANHTAVLWNGLSLSSPMNGQLDLSLMPVGAADDLFIQHGAGSALFGSGAVAGVIHLMSKPQFNRGITTKVDASFGSFSDFRQTISYEISKEKWVSSIQLFNTTAQNDFLFTNEYSSDRNQTRQIHANLKNRGLINENKWLLGRNHTLSLNAWLQTTDRNLPPTLLQQQSLATQADDALRLHAGWNYTKGKVRTFVRTGWLNERLIFIDELADLHTTSRTQQLITEAETKITFNPAHEINFGLHHTFATASNENFEQNPQQNRTALFAAYQYHSKNQKLHTRLAARAEMVDQNLAPFTFSAGGDYQVFKWLTAKASLSKVYRIPTFNDLYWTPGGNPNLLPESGYAQEAGVSVRWQRNELQFTSDLSLFNRNIDNWIIWLPGISFWRPQNIMEVWSRGMETNSTLTCSRGKARVALTLLTNYVLSENQRSKSPNDASVGRQLIYTPIYSGMAKISFAYQNLMIGYRHNYVGYRYTSTDNTQFLRPFDLGALQASYQLKFHQYTGRLFFEINNVWNEQYQIISNRPMPGINFNSGFSIQINKHNTN